MSALEGVIAKLRRGETLDPAAIDELERLLDALQALGWSGYMAADEAVRAITGKDE